MMGQSSMTEDDAREWVSVWSLRPDDLVEGARMRWGVDGREYDVIVGAITRETPDGDWTVTLHPLPPMPEDLRGEWKP